MSVVNKAKIDVIDRDTQVQAGIIDECLNRCKKINSRTDKVMDRLKNQLMYGQAYGPLKKSRESKSLLEKSLLGGIFKGTAPPFGPWLKEDTKPYAYSSDFTKKDLDEQQAGARPAPLLNVHAARISVI